MNTNKKYLSAAMAFATIASLAVGFSAFAQTPPANSMGGQGGWMQHAGHGTGMGKRTPSVMGTITAINGGTITISGHAGFGGRPKGASGTTAPVTTTYTIDAANAKVTKSGTAGGLSTLAIGDTVLVQGTISGSSVTATAIFDGVPMGMGNGVAGKVTAISGSTLTVSGRNNTSYTVNAGNATVTKNNAASTYGAIAVGDMIFAQGTVSGTTVTATTIRDGVMQGSGINRPGGASSTLPVIGNGQPVVEGAVTAISGSTLTITNKSNVTYTVDASNAKFLQGEKTAGSLSAIAVGDSVVVQGPVSGSSITATTVIDQPRPSSATPVRRGFFGGIGAFFSHLFGF